jgi:hypothetical protein
MTFTLVMFACEKCGLNCKLSFVTVDEFLDVPTACPHTPEELVPEWRGVR